jgi:uncharacterized cupredoxin-like copper-binding protein
MKDAIAALRGRYGDAHRPSHYPDINLKQANFEDPAQISAMGLAPQPVLKAGSTSPRPGGHALCRSFWSGNTEPGEARKGETIRLVLQNEGRMRHELVLGDKEALRRHAALMQMMPDMQHSGPNMASLAPGERDELIWKFTRTGTVSFACLQTGHMEAGMRGAVAVQ